jgi:hypothetical protein
MLDGQRHMFCEDSVREAAAEICRENRMQLARIEDAADNIAIRDYASLHALNYLWFGARDRTATGRWSWEDGQPLDEPVGGQEPFSAWASGEPSEDNLCAVIDEKGEWRAVPCGNVYDSVCELSLDL